MEKYITFSEAGILTFTDVLIKTKLISKLNLTITVTHKTPVFHNSRSQTSSSSVSEYQTLLEEILTIETLSCTKGTIKTLDDACQPCQSGTYSLIDPMKVLTINFFFIKKK